MKDILHYGVKGMKWDETKGKLTPEEKARLRAQDAERRKEKKEKAQARKDRKFINKGVEVEKGRAKRSGRDFDVKAAKDRLSKLLADNPGLKVKEALKEDKRKKYRAEIKLRQLLKLLKDRKLRVVQQSEGGYNMANLSLNEFLAHHGIKGQRWGIRRKKNSSGLVSQDHAAVAKLRRKPLSQLSNDDIKKLTARLNLEKSYRELAPSRASRSQKLLGKFFKQYSTSVVDKAAQDAAGASYALMKAELKKRRQAAGG